MITARSTVFRKTSFTHRGLSGLRFYHNFNALATEGEVSEALTYCRTSRWKMFSMVRQRIRAESEEHAGDASAETALVECLQQLGQIPDVSLRQLNVRDQQALVDAHTARQGAALLLAPKAIGQQVTLERCGYKRTIIADYGSAACQIIFIGEVMDVTGWLGGYNFQWAWSAHGTARRIWRLCPRTIKLYTKH